MSATLANVELVSKDFWGSVGGAIETVATAIKDVVVWCGHVIKVLFTDYIVPGMKKVWPYIVSGLSALWSFLKTPVGLGTMGLVAGVGVGLGLLAYANRDEVEDGKDIVTRVMLRVFAGLSFALGGAAFAAGIAFGMG